jgi:hypothetical protein
MKRILFISNGHGEDLVAAELINRLDHHQIECLALPLVGEGKVFDSLPIRVFGARKAFPSGGFSLRNLRYFLKDIYAGLLGNTIDHCRILINLRGKVDLTIAVGDIIPLLGAMAVKAPALFIGVNKSSYYRWFGYNYTFWEKFLLRKYARKVFVRDRKTEMSLNLPNARYVGNPLMDFPLSLSLQSGPSWHEKIFRNRIFDLGNSSFTLGFLPGTRRDAKLNLDDFEKIIEELIKLKTPDVNFKFITAATLNNIPEYLTNVPFPELLAQADLVVGLSGTGNEQAAGSGIPIVSFYGRGSQYNRKFAEAQKQLLGKALCLVRDRAPICIAAEIIRLLRTPQKMEEMGKEGRARMGESGAIAKIINHINTALNQFA